MKIAPLEAIMEHTMGALHNVMLTGGGRAWLEALKRKLTFGRVI